MVIALSFNLRKDDSEEQAEFDSLHTIDRVSACLRKLGERVELIELSRPLEQLVSDLARIKPELIFNIGEGQRGRLREALWPAIFEQMNIHYTGSDAYALALSLDKQLAKEVVEKAGARVPKGKLFFGEEKESLGDMNLPVIIKPNFEGSSKGITQSSVVDNVEDFSQRIRSVVKKYPDGVLVEEYIEGKDVTLPFIETPDGMMLAPMEYEVAKEVMSGRKYSIYDYDLKGVFADKVKVKEARIADDVRTEIYRQMRLVVSAIGCRDFGRLDFRVNSKGEVYFIEINCLPSLEEGASIFMSAALKGVDEFGVIRSVVESACRRHGLNL